MFSIDELISQHTDDKLFDDENEEESEDVDVFGIARKSDPGERPRESPPMPDGNTAVKKEDLSVTASEPARAEAATSDEPGAAVAGAAATVTAPEADGPRECDATSAAAAAAESKQEEPPKLQRQPSGGRQAELRQRFLKRVEEFKTVIAQPEIDMGKLRALAQTGDSQQACDDGTDALVHVGIPDEPGHLRPTYWKVPWE